MNLSLRARLLLGTIAASLVVLGSASLALYGLTRRSLFSELDSYLLAKARAVAALVEVEGDEEHEERKVGLADLPEGLRAEVVRRTAGRRIVEIERKVKRGRVVYEVEAAAGDEKVELELRSDEKPPPPPPPRIELEVGPERFPEFRAGGGEFLVVATASGETVFRSPSLAGARLPREAPRAVLPDGRPLRLARLAFAPEHHPEARLEVVVARDVSDLLSTLRRLARALVVVCLAAVVLSSALMALAVSRGTRPVRALAERIGSIGEATLGERLPTEELPRELRPVAERMNDLLARLQAAFEREKTFSANVAHELRTPLAGLLSTLEVALRRGAERGNVEGAARESLAIARQMHAMVENLLAMARCEAGRLEVATESVELTDFIRRCWAPFQERAIRRALSIEWHLEGDCTITTDREKLRLILNNLFDNAATYANEGGRIRIALRRGEGTAELTVSNTGCDLTDDQVAHVFERFWRGDAARTEAGVHCGLGLPLCRRLVEVLGGRIAVEAAGGEFTARLSLPVHNK